MAKKTLLQLTQDVLDAISGDAVNNITDTEEALQVVGYIHEVYDEMMAGKDWPHLNMITQLSSVGEATLPNFLSMPDNIDKVHFIMYNKRKENDSRNYWAELRYLHPDEFVLKCASRNSEDASVTQVTTPDGAVLNIINDTPPTHYTSFDDKYIVVDSWDSDVESTVTAGQTQLFCQRNHGWTTDNDFVPELPSKLFPMLLAESISLSAYRLKEEADEKAEQMSARQQRKMSRDAFRAQKQQRYPDYGRKGARAPMTKRGGTTTPEAGESNIHTTLWFGS